MWYRLATTPGNGFTCFVLLGSCNVFVQVIRFHCTALDDSPCSRECEFNNSNLRSLRTSNAHTVFICLTSQRGPRVRLQLPRPVSISVSISESLCRRESIRKWFAVPRIVAILYSSLFSSSLVDAGDSGDDSGGTKTCLYTCAPSRRSVNWISRHHFVRPRDHVGRDHEKGPLGSTGSAEQWRALLLFWIGFDTAHTNW